jgi:hypothetical protein
VVERARRAGFPLETGDVIGVARQASGQHFDGHVAPEPRIAGAPDLAHPDPAEQFHNLEVSQLGARAQSFDGGHWRAFQEGIGLLIQVRSSSYPVALMLLTFPYKSHGRLTIFH